MLDTYLEARNPLSSALEVERISKSFGSNRVLKDVTFSIESRNIGTLVGPSGSGKSTLLNIISGIYDADEGKITIDGQVVESGGAGSKFSLHAKPAERNVGYVFQDYLLFPHMSVFENIAFGLRARHFSESSIKNHVISVLKTVGLEELRDRKPSEISGGQMQRVALARALVLEPKLLLLDEPLSALDRQTRETLRVELKKIFDSIGTTVVYVTHDLDEAFFLGQQIGILRSGELISFGRKTDLLKDMNRSTAEFLGFNLAKAQLRRTEGLEQVVFVPDLETEVRVSLSRESKLEHSEKDTACNTS